ncbi:GspE/PulE family protein [Parasphingorhabdus sp.]|uniref:GspE/PulE family protein n=1 Tax=Parasphingorhabdus sp. TaxID=2709688 RepID=UPI003A8CEF0A
MTIGQETGQRTFLDSGGGCSRLIPDHQSPAGLEPALPVTDISYDFARNHGILMKAIERERLIVALHEDADPLCLLAVSRHLALPLDVERVDRSKFEELLSAHYATDAALSERPDYHDDAMINDIMIQAINAESLSDIRDQPAGIRLIHAIIAEAARQGASDIHIKIFDSALNIRMRIDGRLHDKLQMPLCFASDIAEQIKQMARLDIADHRIPQEGRARFTLSGKTFDVRISTLPNAANEYIILNIGDRQSANIALNLPGLSGDSLAILSEALSSPDGIILVAGLAGSGKTATLYACMEQFNDGRHNILTIENPIEYAIETISQTQVDVEHGSTYAEGLTAILRQDPDVVMVGEIGDRETLDIAIQSAQKGLIILSTVDSNDAVGAITKLLDMKVNPFRLASTIRAIVAQRLVRKLCEACRQPIQADGSLASLLGFDRGTVVYRETGCAKCNYTGFQGDIGVFEAIRIDDTIRKLVNDGGDESRIAAHAFLQNRSLASSARQMVRDGITTAEEGIRVSR